MSNSNNQGSASNSRDSNSNRVSGPTSALSSFLREHGITAPSRSRRTRREAAANAAELVTTDTNNNTEEADLTTSTEVTAMEVDEPESSTAAQTRSRSSRITMTYRTRQSIASSKKKAPTNKKGKRKGKDSGSDSDSDSDSSDDLGITSFRRTARGRSRIIFCDTCNTRFIRKIGEKEESTTCPNCLKGGSVKKAAPKRKRTVVKIAKKTYSPNLLPSLQDICINIVADNIDDVESFGFISDDSFEKIAKIISRNRKLNDRTSLLFMEPHRKELKLYDCTNMNEDALMNVANFCYRTERLKLEYCGHLTDKVLQAYAEKLKGIKALALSGSFLITKEAYIEFFEKVGERLEVFELRHSARLNLDCMNALVKYCPNIQVIKFGHLFEMSSEWMRVVAGLPRLHTLELCWPSAETPFKTEDMVYMLSKIGPQLKTLSIKGGRGLTDEILTDGLMVYCKQLTKLSLEQCDQLTAEGMVKMLNSWPNKGLKELDISRCILFDDAVLRAVIRHSGTTLTHLNLHSLEKITPNGLEYIAGEKKIDEDDGIEPCKELTWLDCGFVRSMDDFVLHKLIANCKLIQDIQVWGCHLLTENIPSKANLRIVGREIALPL